MKTYIKRAVLWIASVAVVAGIATTFVSYNEVEAQNPEIKVIDLTPEKIESLKDDVVARLLSCESAGHKEDDAIIMYDNNKAGTLTGKNVWSIGQLQWKVSTIVRYAQMRDNKVLTQKEAVLLALDTNEASKLAKYVIFDTDGGIWNWQNCADKLNLGAEVSAIKKLLK